MLNEGRLHVHRIKNGTPSVHLIPFKTHRTCCGTVVDGVAHDPNWQISRSEISHKSPGSRLGNCRLRPRFHRTLEPRDFPNLAPPALAGLSGICRNRLFRLITFRSLMNTDLHSWPFAE